MQPPKSFPKQPVETISSHKFESNHVEYDNIETLPHADVNEPL